jgi:hypothetical protein
MAARWPSHRLTLSQSTRGSHATAAWRAFGSFTVRVFRRSECDVPGRRCPAGGGHTPQIVCRLLAAAVCRAGICYSVACGATATASISIRRSGTNSRETSTSVLAGGLAVSTNSSRAPRIAPTASMSRTK